MAFDTKSAHHCFVCASLSNPKVCSAISVEESARVHPAERFYVTLCSIGKFSDKTFTFLNNYHVLAPT